MGTSNTNPFQPRSSIEIFSLLMEKRMQENDHREGWKRIPIQELHFRAQKALDEVRDAIASGDTVAIFKNAADVANLLMMLADNAVDGVPGDRKKVSLIPSHRQLDITLGKWAAGYTPGCEEWSELDQEALMYAYHGDERMEVPFNG